MRKSMKQSNKGKGLNGKVYQSNKNFIGHSKIHIKLSLYNLKIKS